MVSYWIRYYHHYYRWSSIDIVVVVVVVLENNSRYDWNDYCYTMNLFEWIKHFHPFIDVNHFFSVIRDLIFCLIFVVINKTTEKTPLHWECLKINWNATSISSSLSTIIVIFNWPIFFSQKLKLHIAYWLHIVIIFFLLLC